MAGGSALPRVHAMVLCDEIDAVAGQEEVFHLRGVRTYIQASAFPYTHPQFCVYLQVAGRQGRTACQVVVVRAGTDEALHQSDEQEIPLRGPLDPVPVLWWIQSCSFPEPGVYYVQACFDGKVCSERLLILSEDEGTGNGRRPT